MPPKPCLFNTRETGNNSFDIQLVGGNKIHADIGNGTSWLTNVADVSYQYAIDQWMHIAYTVTPTGYTIYVNGEQLTTGLLSGTPLLLDANHKLVLGRNSGENTYFKGSMDEVKVFNAALSATQVKREMTGNGVDVNANLVAYFNFNSHAVTQSKQLRDESGNERHGTLTNFALTGTASNWVESYAMVFPTNANAYTNGVDNAAIYWNKPQLGAVENYMLEVAKNNTFTQPITGSPFTVAGSSSEQVITGLTPNATYYYRLKANKASVAEQGVYTQVQSITIAKTLATGNALNFDGVDDYVSMSSGTANLSGNFTVMLWVKPDDVTKAMHLFSTREPASNAFDIQLIGGNRIHGDIGPGIGNWITTSADANYNYRANQWLHIAYTVSPTGYKIYANGQEVGNGVLSGTPLLVNASNIITLGKNGTEDTYFKGNLDEVKVFSSTLSALEIKEEMLGNTTALAANRILYYDFNLSAPSKMLYNYTGADYNGMLNNFALSGTASNWVESYAMVLPAATNASAIDGTKFAANWTAPTIGQVDNYILEVATNNTFSSPIAGSPFTVNGLAKEITGLNTVTNYYYRVHAEKTSVAGQGAFSEIITLNTGKINQTIVFNSLNDKVYGNSTFNLTASASSNLPVSYSSSNENVATISGGTVTIVGAGTTTIMTLQGGNATYNAAVAVQQILTVKKANQTISFAALDPKTTANTDFLLGATATSGLPVSYTSENTTIAEVYENNGVWKVKVKAAGSVEITATQTGNANYAAAINEKQTLLVIDAVLPVELISYTAKIESNYAKLQWQAKSERNNKGYIVYRSGDDKQFVQIGEVLAVLNLHLTTYNHIDKQPLNGNNYYKLVQVDNDGKQTELGVKPLTFNFQSSTFNFYPNPTKDKVRVNFEASKYTRLVLSTVDGKVLTGIQLNPQQNKLEIDLSTYPIGTYFIRLSGAQESIVKKVVKQ